MNVSAADRRSHLGRFPGMLNPRLCNWGVEALRPRRWGFLVMPTGRVLRGSA